MLARNVMVAAVMAPRRVCLVLLASIALGPVACAADGDGPALAEAQRIELQTLGNQLTDPSRTPKTKREAATLLLTRSYPQARAAVKRFLSDNSNRPAQIAVAEAIAQTGRTNKEFIKPLLGMLTGGEPSIRAPAANALAAYKDGGVLGELTRLASAAKTDQPTRLVVISAMGRILDKQAVAALVTLLGDSQEPIRNAASDALGRLTNIRAFGRDVGRWRQWWAENKNKRRGDWLADLAESLARANQQLERTGSELRRRLAAAMNDLHAATPPAQRDALLTGMLKDDVGEVRLVGIVLTRERLAGGAKLSEPLKLAVRARVTDPEAPVRKVAALLLANIPDPKSVEILSARLKVEQAPEVREAIYRGLGLGRDVAVWDLVVPGIGEQDRSVAAAAAAAMARLAEKNGIANARRTAAVKALTARYEASGGEESAALREALLGAMETLKDKRLGPLMTAALKDPAATVRLSAVKGLHALGEAGRGSEVAALMADADRGVRLAAIAAIGDLGGLEHLDAVLARADAAGEDAAVRQQAWTVAMALLAKADTARLKALADKLAARKDASKHLIEVLKLWAGKIPAANVDEWAPVRLRLGEALLAADRPAEAAGELAAVHAALAKAGEDEAPQVRLKWIVALLAAGDPSAVGRIAETKEPAQFAVAVKALQSRLAALKLKKDADAMVRLASAAVGQLGPRLSAADKQALTATLGEAQARQREADRQRVSALVARLTGADKAAAAAAGKELTAMGNRAVKPLLAELKAAVPAPDAKPEAEKAILTLLASLAPKLTGYDPAAPPADRIKKIDAWLKQLGS